MISPAIKHPMATPATSPSLSPLEAFVLAAAVELTDDVVDILSSVLNSICVCDNVQEISSLSWKENVKGMDYWFIDVSTVARGSVALNLCACISAGSVFNYFPL